MDFDSETLLKHQELGIQSERLPRHIAIIMDGNGRWAKKQGLLERIFGHKSAIEAVRDTVEGAAEIGVSFLTVFAFSTENWQRPKKEVDGLMNLLSDTIEKETPTLMKNNIRLNTIGNSEDLPKKCLRKLIKAVEATKNNTRMTFTLALSYGGRADIVKAVQGIAAQLLEGKISAADITPELVRANLSTNDLPDPELLIRTSGEFRISNFLLWEVAYSEIYITPTLWPDFRRKDLAEAIVVYQKRERRFGKTSEQVAATKKKTIKPV